MWGVVDVSVWTNPCLSVQNIALSRENPLAAGYSKADPPELQPLYCIIWKAVAGRVVPRCEGGTLMVGSDLWVAENTI